MRGRPTGVVLAAVLLLSAHGALGAAQEALRELVVPLKVNDMERGEVLVLLGKDDVMVPVADLVRAGVRELRGTRVEHRGVEYVSLRSLGREVSFRFDEEALALSVTFPPSFFTPRRFDLGRARPLGMKYGKDTSGFFNYSVSWRKFESLDGFAEAGASVKGSLLYSSVSRTASGDFVRGQTNLTIDDLGRLNRLVVGDTFATAGGLGGSLYLAGVSLTRQFDLDPYFVRYPTLTLTGAVSAPSTAEVYVNGALVGRQELAPGQFDLTNLPVPAGSGTARVVIRDAFGQERTLTNPFYASTAVLAAGLHEYGYNLGFRRENVGTMSADYGELAFLGFHRYGASDRISPGMRLEGDRHLASGGPFVAFRLGAGEAEIGAAASSARNRSGTAWSVSYRYLGRPVNVGFFARGASDRYATLALDPDQDRARVEADAFVGLQLGGRLGVTGQFTRADMRDAPTSTRTSMTANFTMRNRSTLFLSGSRTRRGGETSSEVLVGFSYSFAAAALATVSAARSAGVSSASLDVIRSLPVGPGYGYRANVRRQEGETVGYGAAQLQGPYGRYELSADHTNGQTDGTLTVSGGVVAIGDRVLLSRNVGQSFALIRVPGVEGVMGYVNNQAAGRTDPRGDLLVPDLLPYYGNRLGIADQDIPIDYRIDGTELVIAPPYRGGVIAPFPVRPIRSVRGTLVIVFQGREIVPARGVLTVEAAGQGVESPIGNGGEFYFDDLGPGEHDATADFRRGTCSFTLRVPVSSDAVVDLGRVTCEARTLLLEEP